MSRFVQSLRRLYKAGKVTEEKLTSMKEAGIITQEEYDFIIAE